jgi:Zn-dependent peptidase ImmA (M78 family)
VYKPNNITICGLPYEIKYKKMSDWGLTDADRKIIYLNSNIEDEELLVDTLLHEVFHVVLYVSGFYFSVLKENDKYEEGLVRLVENLFTPVVKKIVKDCLDSAK